MTGGAPDSATIDFIMPVYNEGPNITRALDEIDRLVPIPKRVLIVYDFEGDDTVPVVRGLGDRFPWAVLQKNDLGRGVINAIRAGIAAATAEVVIITMADLSDDLGVVPKMVELIGTGGFDIVCASRYMRGGRQIGGPWLKRMLSRTAGLSLYRLGALPVHDATNSFRAYRRTVLVEFPIESQGGFAYTLEVTAKAHAAGRKITEVPTTWRDRSAGQSRFKLRAWLPEYLRWYRYALTHKPRSSGCS
jgi:glycosyltransferase involved in cell wall biosynthesis